MAGTVLGGHEPCTASPYSFTDQYDLGMEYRGHAERDELVVRGDVGAREFTVFWLREGRVQAAMNVNQWDDGDALQALVDARGELPWPLTGRNRCRVGGPTRSGAAAAGGGSVLPPATGRR